MVTRAAQFVGNPIVDRVSKIPWPHSSPVTSVLRVLGVAHGIPLR